MKERFGSGDGSKCTVINLRRRREEKCVFNKFKNYIMPYENN